MRHYPVFVNGKHVDTEERAYGFDVAALFSPEDARALWRQALANDPALDDHPLVLGSAAMVTDELQEQALAGAAAAWPQWMVEPLAHRMRFAANVRRLVQARYEELTALMMAEGCPRPLAHWQLDSVLIALGDESLAWHAAMMEQQFQVDGQLFTSRRRPDGVVCLNPPRNAPTSNAFMCVWALAAGNSVVMRVPRSCPVSLSYAMHEIVVPALDACRAPAGTLQIFCADQPATMRKWLSSPHVNDILFFGTSENGASVQRRCVEAGKKPILELSGNDGVLVWDDADVEAAAISLSECFLGSGQICMAPKYAIVHPAVADELISHLIVQAAAQRAGHPTEDGVTLSPVLLRSRFFQWLRESLDAGASLVYGGNEIDAFFVEPTVLRVDGFEAAQNLRVVREETFFPLMPVVVPDPSSSLLDQTIRFMNANRYGLRNSLWARNPAVIDHFLAHINNGGNLRINQSHLSCHPLLPTHGGTGMSGGVWGEANIAMLRTTHLQGIARPLDTV